MTAPSPPAVRTLVSAARLECRFGSTRAVHDVTCTVVAGQHIAVTGPSGSGKSTLLHLFAGLQVPTSGGLAWPDLGGDPRQSRALTAMVFQAPSLLNALDVVHNVQLPLLLAGRPTDAADRAAHAALVAVGIGDLATRTPDELSGGQAQRVAVARALAMRARIILADEPTGQLDHASADLVLTTLLDAATASGAALIVATHDPRIAARLPVVWRMDHGRLDIHPDRSRSGGAR